MNYENFCYWLQGHFEIDPNNNVLTENQVKMIKEHLGYVFKKHIVIPAGPFYDQRTGITSSSLAKMLTDPGSAIC